MKNSIELYRVNLRLNSSGYRKWIDVIQVRETNKSFVGSGKRIDKSKILVLDSMFIQRHNLISYYTYCKKEDISTAVDLIKKRIVAMAKQFNEECNQMFSHVDDSIE